MYEKTIFKNIKNLEDASFAYIDLTMAAQDSISLVGCFL